MEDSIKVHHKKYNEHIIKPINMGTVSQVLKKWLRQK